MLLVNLDKKLRLKTYTNVSDYDCSQKSVVTIGTFDGVHLGHHKIIKRLLSVARVQGLESIILTFFPHPRMVLQKESNIKLINTIEERAQILENLGLGHLVVHPFDTEFSELSPEAYVKKILLDGLDIHKVIIGYDHRFGKNRAANFDDLLNFSKIYNFEVEEITKEEVSDVAVSSTKIRRALEEGDIQKANTYLGYAFMLTGTVVKGQQLGRTLGYPTANLHIKENYKLIPKNGVYVVKAIIEGKTVFGLTNIGTKPTVDGTTQTIETYFMDFESDLYGQNLQIRLLERIRDEKKFESLNDLQQAMQQDEVFARQYIQANF